MTNELWAQMSEEDRLYWTEGLASVLTNPSPEARKWIEANYTEPDEYGFRRKREPTSPA